MKHAWRGDTQACPAVDLIGNVGVCHFERDGDSVSAAAQKTKAWAACGGGR